jgi:hypothetical protein
MGGRLNDREGKLFGGREIMFEMEFGRFGVAAIGG